MTDDPAQLLHRPKRPKALISMVPMIDVMLILLIFFMVTSTYINLDMIPALERSADATADPQPTQGDGGDVLMVRIGADGTPTIRGQAYAQTDLERLFADRIRQDANQQVLILPSGSANMQALVSVMDTATLSGVTQLQIVRLDASP
ncbi:ExbD/TolR family protein [Sulfitobacter mediterraneus]|uniref:Biopolymer transport protein ExbD n=1 Tax=Sulfitobacter mediterraneus TaxID=83219 RepID=A0A2T6C8X0_9RHOB|nr:biopolymer transporter ExbD [Sulfitobacter mediterraneus]KIN75714.1 Biopolymer transport protein, ExbD/TolR family [Sulfitobacter mediterraneus KCTC 32188]PTX64760.1 biopolymer transport protein ExbD [Sulfitobacter mediterraneus]UWR12394.1 biopolymer transporter ExbD [Sulfitobacter mediterraneus]